MRKEDLEEENPKMSKVFSAMKETEDDDLDAATTPFFGGANPFDAKPTGKVTQTTGHTGAVSVTNTKKTPMGGPRSADAQMRKPNADVSAANATDKPKYPGSFVGQVASGGKKGVYKSTSWMGPDQQRRFGKVHSMQANDQWVWDGSSWIKSGAFDAKFPKTKKECTLWESIIERVGLKK